jgi:hypothetical protein
MNRTTRASLALLAVFVAAGCASPIGVSPVDRRHVLRELSVDGISSDSPSIVSRQVVLRLGLSDLMGADPVAALAELHARIAEELGRDAEIAADRLFALAEYSFLHASNLQTDCERRALRRIVTLRRHWVSRESACDQARQYYIATSIYAFAFIFPDDPSRVPSPFDPRLRTAADLYNLAVTAAVRQRGGAIDTTSIDLSFHLGRLHVEIDPQGLQYADRLLGDFVPASQLEVRGLRNRYRHAGIGAPFLAKAIPREGVTLPLSSARVATRIRIPVTIFVRYENLTDSFRSGEYRARSEIFSENRAHVVEVGTQRVPLEYETTAALAYSLEDSDIWEFEIAGFRSGDAMQGSDGLVMLEPYRNGKIPVVFVHGTASSPARWAEMINEYRSDPVLRDNYQFWLFMYSTGNPILYSAGLLRASLKQTLAEIDPDGRDPALRRMIVVGHSQGGLLTKLQAISSGTTFWDNVSETPFDEIEISQETRELVGEAMFFERQPFVDRVVFISTPHRGSFLAGNWMGRFASSLFTAPAKLGGVSIDLARAGVSFAGDALDGAGSVFGLIRRDPGEELEREMARLPSSVDNMDPNHPFIRSLQSIPVEAPVHAHSIIPVRGTAPPDGQNDGVVEYSSAHIDEAETEYVVYRSTHSTQAHPSTIQELRRILLDNLETQ